MSGSSAFSNSNLYIWKFSVHKLLKPSLKDFEHNLESSEISTIVQQFEDSLALPFLGNRTKTDFSNYVATAEFSKFAVILNDTLTTSFFRILNS